MKLLNRIATPILSLLVIPAVIFLPMFRVMVAFNLSASETKTNMLKLIGLKEFISFKDLYELIKPIMEGSEEGFAGFFNMISDDKKSQFLGYIPNMEWLITAGVALVVVLIVAVVLAVVAAACKKPGASVIVSAIGIVATAFMKFSFDKFAYPLLNGGLNLGTIIKDMFNGNLDSILDLSKLEDFGGMLSGLLGGLTENINLGQLIETIASRIVSVDYMQLSIAYTAILIIFVVALILSVMAHVAHKNER